jgi:hypothetical protein
MVFSSTNAGFSAKDWSIWATFSMSSLPNRLLADVSSCSVVNTSTTLVSLMTVDVRDASASYEHSSEGRFIWLRKRTKKMPKHSWVTNRIEIKLLKITHFRKQRSINEFLHEWYILDVSVGPGCKKALHTRVALPVRSGPHDCELTTLQYEAGQDRPLASVSGAQTHSLAANREYIRHSRYYIGYNRKYIKHG